MNSLVNVETLVFIFGLTGAAYTPPGHGFDLLVSFSPVPFAGCVVSTRL